MTLGDLKALFFYAALFPALVDVPALTWFESLAIATATGVSVGGVKLAYAWLACRIGRAQPGGSKGLPCRLAGGVSIGTGVVVLART
jgi:threonine/homoserine/homoserine lactone efflux protein